MPRFDFGRIKPDAPLTYLLPILGVMLLVLIWTALIDYLEREHDVAVRNTIADTEGNARAFANHTEQVLRHIDQVTRLVQFEFEKTRGRGDTFDFEATIRRAVVSFKGLALVALCLVRADPALDGLGHALGRQAQLESVCVLDYAMFS